MVQIANFWSWPKRLGLPSLINLISMPTNSGANYKFVTDSLHGKQPIAVLNTLASFSPPRRTRAFSAAFDIGCNDPIFHLS
jgi:hypothetical protein